MGTVLLLHSSLKDDFRGTRAKVLKKDYSNSIDIGSPPLEAATYIGALLLKRDVSGSPSHLDWLGPS